MMKYKFIFVALALFLTGCDDRTPEQRAYDDAAYCTPHLVSEAPDGVKLYRVDSRCSKVSGRDVFFSSSGTQTSHVETHRTGKVTTSETIDDVVPNKDQP